MTIEHEWIQALATRWPATDFRHDTFYAVDTRQIVTTDMIVEGVHFDWAYSTPMDVGWKSVAVNLSDIAATGGIPQWVFVNIGVPEKKALTSLTDIFEGIQTCCETYACRVVGGDTVHAPQTVISVTVIGTLPQGAQPGRRHHAQPGDVLAMSGPHGLSHGGLLALQQRLPGYDSLKHTHLRPTPQLALGQAVATHASRFAMMDSSDGLADAVLQLARASQVDILLQQDKLTLHPELLALAQVLQADPWAWCLYGGEDFELVVALPESELRQFPDLHPIGTVIAPTLPGGGAGWVETPNGSIPLTLDKTFQHFTFPVETRP